MRPERLRVPLWKAAANLYFEDFLSLCFPTIHETIDWRRPYRFLDPDLHKLIRNNAESSKRIHALVEVPFKNSDGTILLIHVEPQARIDSGLDQDASRISEGFECCVASLASLFKFSATTWTPGVVRGQYLASEAYAKLPLCKLLVNPTIPEKPDNAFSWLLAAQHQADLTQGRSRLRKSYKVNLAQSLICSGQPEGKILDLLRLFDWILPLPPGLERGYEAELARFQTEHQLQFSLSPHRPLV